MTQWARLSAALGGLEHAAPAAPERARRAAALALLRDRPDGDLEIVYTRRRDDLSNHPGQIAFPGGRVDADETVDAAAVREAVEEVHLDAATVEVLGRLPAFYIPPSRFWLQVAVARWRAPHPLVPAEAEVAEILHVPLATLRDPARWRVVRLTDAGHSWAWQLDERHLLWGATAIVTGVILDVLDPGWSGRVRPESLPPDRVVEPWAARDATAPRPRPPRLAGVPEVPIDDPLMRAGAGDAEVTTDVAAAAVAAAVAALTRAPEGARVVVLVGSGGTGKVGRAAADVLREAGAAVVIVDDASAGLPDADVLVDAVVGRGLDGPLRGAARELTLLLRQQAVPVVSVDVPSGLHPDDGLIGEVVTADVTVAVGAPAPGLFHAGVAPFVGDLYLAAAADEEGETPLLRLVPGADAGRWRE